MNKITSFFKGVRAELGKVVWPTRRQAVWLTVVVIVITIVVAYYLGAFDILFTKILDLIV